MIPISLELYSVRNSFQKDLKKTLNLVKSYGYEGVEYAGKMDKNILKNLKDGLDDVQLKSKSWHAEIDRLSSDLFDETVFACKEIGCEALIIPSVAHEYYESEKKAMEFCDILNENSERLKPYGIKLGYHNHMSEFTKLDNGKSIWTLFCQNTSPDIIMQFDTGNAIHGNADIDEEFKSMKNRMGIIHIKPYSIKDKFEVLIGDDDVDYVKVFDFCKTQGGTYSYVIEYEGLTRYEEMNAAKRCLENLKSKYKKIL